jgi:hypothetical protein
MRTLLATQGEASQLDSGRVVAEQKRSAAIWNLIG